jgi:hypothetical protein
MMLMILHLCDITTLAVQLFHLHCHCPGLAAGPYCCREQTVAGRWGWRQPVLVARCGTALCRPPATTSPTCCVVACMCTHCCCSAMTTCVPVWFAENIKALSTSHSNAGCHSTAQGVQLVVTRSLGSVVSHILYILQGGSCCTWCCALQRSMLVAGRSAPCRPPSTTPITFRVLYVFTHPCCKAKMACVPVLLAEELQGVFLQTTQYCRSS